MARFNYIASASLRTVVTAFSAARPAMGVMLERNSALFTVQTDDVHLTAPIVTCPCLVFLMECLRLLNLDALGRLPIVVCGSWFCIVNARNG